MSFVVPIATLAGLAIFVGSVLALLSRVLKVEKEFKVKVVNDGNELTVGWNANLLEALKAAGYGMMAACGGQGVCGTCRVRVIEGLEEPTPAQLGPLKGKLREEGWVLSCQTQVQNDLVIELFAPLVSAWPEVGEAAEEAAEAKAKPKAKELSPAAQRVRARLPGFDCGVCGYETCDDYAAAVAEGKAPQDGCYPGGELVVQGVRRALLGLELRKALPGFDCGVCGYKTCDDYAAAIADGEASDKCYPGGEPVQERLKALLDQSE